MCFPDVAYDLDGVGWTKMVIIQLSDFPHDVSDVLSKSKTDFGSCSLLPVGV